VSGFATPDFLAYWQAEGDALARHGDYDWMAAQVPGRRVVEIGCGPGFGTQALLGRGFDVLVVDSITDCLATARERTGGADGRVTFVDGDVTALGSEARAAIAAFCADTVVCWLMGAPAELTGASGSAGDRAVAAYRERVHRAVAELATELAGVAALHIVDRTVIAWQAKDVGRDVLVRYHGGTTLAGLPFAAARAGALYRKLDGSGPRVAQSAAVSASIRGVVPVLASLLAERKN
jgi:SAM-dependent methyltransferase